jgi:hypothetical protein
MTPSSRQLRRLAPPRWSVATHLMLALLGTGSLGSAALGAQQLPDRDFAPPIARPAYAAATGPRLCVDEAHNNFHTLDDRFFAFGNLARRDGFRVRPNRDAFTAQALAACDILVISNAQNGIPWDRQPRPTPSAFTDAEIAAVRAWVERGGNLLLIADHQPLAGAARDLAAAFGATFVDGFAYAGAEAAAIETARGGGSAEPTLFRPRDGTLDSAHAIAKGRGADERITQVRSFTGQAFRWDEPGVAAVLRLPPDYVSLEPRYAWQFDSTTVYRPVGGWLQGATRRVGSGRVALFGEAAMFSAQVAGPQRRPMGMNAPLAEQNPQFVLNVLRWASGLLEP